ncbi:L,D-transpeptidase family protein [Ensifer sp. LCM 4579]|uniref:L,D-transpeptidase family protein n=1 Tax=Ensifer sp. LCM 4579 TaxID=1848292 RepID=UPI0008DB1AA0|nr:L,D-transpeptidase family protein [Ensifer sp. LCM 4579]OHV72106.1 hypothetical protein LCM4579_12345 [Ensifer sp. LCM 4579]
MRSTLRIGLVVLAVSSSSAAAAGKPPLQIVVSRQQQSLAVYDGDRVIATSNVSTGRANHRTPTGIFSILEKRRHHESNIYSNAPMPFMQRLTWSGIALHGSKHVPDYPASHGCVRLPDRFAADLFKITERGMHVVIAEREVAPVQVSSDVLFQPNQARQAAPLADVPLRPALSHLATGGIEVAMAERSPLPPSFERDGAPIRILITRRGLRESVRDLQMLLNTFGYNAGEPDGYSGPATRAAIRAFQAAEGMPTDGEITPDLLQAVFRKAGRGTPPNGILRVRQDFQPLFEVDIDIAEPRLALGTHFLQFQELDARSGEGKWFGLSLDNALTNATKKRLGITTDADARDFNALKRTLDRITVPEDTRRRIASLLADGSSLSISDTEIGTETGEGTDFIIITQP